MLANDFRKSVNIGARNGALNKFKAVLSCANFDVYTVRILCPVKGWCLFRVRRIHIQCAMHLLFGLWLVVVVFFLSCSYNAKQNDGNSSCLWWCIVWSFCSHSFLHFTVAVTAAAAAAVHKQHKRTHASDKVP